MSDPIERSDKVSDIGKQSQIKKDSKRMNTINKYFGTKENSGRKEGEDKGKTETSSDDIDDDSNGSMECNTNETMDEDQDINMEENNNIGISKSKNERGEMVMESKGAKDLAAEYKVILQGIQTWEYIIEQKTNEYRQTSDKELQQKLEEDIKEAKNLLEKSKKKEKNHILSGSINPDEAWCDSDEEDSDEDDDDDDMIIEEDNQGGQSVTTGKRKNIEEEDISDDDTVVMGELPKADKEEEIKTIANNRPFLNTDESERNWTQVTRRGNKSKQDAKELLNTKLAKENSTKDKYSAYRTQNKISLGRGGGMVENPYYKKVQVTQDISSAQKTPIKESTLPNMGKKLNNNEQGSLPTYLEAIKHKSRKENKYSIRCHFSITPRVASFSAFKSVASEMLEFANEIDPLVMILPWKNNSVYGPINQLDLMNPKSFNNEIAHYINKPPYAAIQPGIPIYKVGICFSTNIERGLFIKHYCFQGKQHGGSK